MVSSVPAPAEATGDRVSVVLVTAVHAGVVRQYDRGRELAQQETTSAVWAVVTRLSRGCRYGAGFVRAWAATTAVVVYLLV